MYYNRGVKSSNDMIYSPCKKDAGSYLKALLSVSSILLASIAEGAARSPTERGEAGRGRPRTCRFLIQRLG